MEKWEKRYGSVVDGCDMSTKMGKPRLRKTSPKIAKSCNNHQLLVKTVILSVMVLASLVSSRLPECLEVEGHRGASSIVNI
uniref:Uncharacterized protein n=1 Tax=Manihot esculenta TaxID=3983 RepID=A0A251K6S7_MANES